MVENRSVCVERATRRNPWWNVSRARHLLVEQNPEVDWRHGKLHHRKLFTKAGRREDDTRRWWQLLCHFQRFFARSHRHRHRRTEEARIAARGSTIRALIVGRCACTLLKRGNYRQDRISLPVRSGPGFIAAKYFFTALLNHRRISLPTGFPFETGRSLFLRLARW